MNGITVVRLVFGASLLLRSRATLGVAGSTADRRATAFARILGVRHLLQALMIGRRTSGRWRYAGAAIDGLHAASMVALAASDERHRRLCLANAATAVGLSLASLAATAGER